MRQVILIILALALTSCANPQAAFRLIGLGKSADVVVQTHLPQTQVRLALLTEEELQVLDASDAVYEQFRSQWAPSAADAEYLLMALVQFESDYSRLTEAYGNYYDVVQAHWDEYAPGIQGSFRLYHQHALQIDSNVQDLLEDGNYSGAAVQALQYITLAAQLGFI